MRWDVRLRCFVSNQVSNDYRHHHHHRFRSHPHYLHFIPKKPVKPISKWSFQIELEQLGKVKCVCKANGIIQDRSNGHGQKVAMFRVKWDPRWCGGMNGVCREIGLSRWQVSVAGAERRGNKLPPPPPPQMRKYKAWHAKSLHTFSLT